MAITYFQPADRFRQVIITDGGGLTSDSASGSSLFNSDGAGNVNVGTQAVNGVTSAVQTLATGNTITVPANTGAVHVTAVAAVTGIIIPVPAVTTRFQELIVFHEGASANTITYSTNVAGGTAQAGVTARKFQWNPNTSLWYACL
jgi:hypothetical protein